MMLPRLQITLRQHISTLLRLQPSLVVVQFFSLLHFVTYIFHYHQTYAYKCDMNLRPIPLALTLCSVVLLRSVDRRQQDKESASRKREAEEKLN